MADGFGPQMRDSAGYGLGDELGPSPMQEPDAWISPTTGTRRAEPFDPSGDHLRGTPRVGPPPDQPAYLGSGSAHNAEPTTAPRRWPELDQMTWRQFELSMADAFRLRGYHVTVTPDGADGGVDLILTGPGVRIFVQCKHWNAWKVGVKTVRELYGVLTAQGATGGIVATSGRFTDEARIFARKANIQLLGRNDVTQMLDAVWPGSNAAPPGLLTSTAGLSGSHPQAAPPCPRCGEPMVLRTAGRGRTRGTSFWGCPRFPACRGRIPISEFATTSTQPWIAVQASNTAWPQARQGPPAGTWRTPRRTGRPSFTRVIVSMALLVGVVIVGGTLMFGALTTAASRLAVAPTVARPVAPARDPRILTSIPLAAKPDQLALDPGHHRLYVTNLEDRSLTVVDTATNTVLSKVALQRQPGGIAVDANADTLWVTNYNEASVSLLNTNGNTRATIKVGHGPVAVALDPGLHKAYVTNSLDKTFNVIDTRTHKITATVSQSYTPGAAAVDPVQHRLCIIATQPMNLQYCYDAALKLSGVTIANSQSIAIDAVTHSRYAISPAAKTLTVVDGTTGRTTTITVGQTPSGVTVDPNTHLAYVADHDDKTILVIRAS